MATSARRGLIALLVVVVVAAGVAFGLRALFQEAKKRLDGTGCTVGNHTLAPDQAAVASSMVGVVLRRDLPERAAVLSLAAGLQESKLRNIPAGEGDRDSVGVLQQRPSQGWGTAAELSDVRIATGKFLDAIVKVRNWQTEPLAEVIQAVQISIDGDLYADDEPKAQALTDALTGKTPAALTCEVDEPTVVAPGATVAEQLLRDLPVNQPTVAGRTVTVPGAGWSTATWFVANADRLGIDTVAHAAKVWHRDGGWRDEAAPSNAVVATMHQL